MTNPTHYLLFGIPTFNSCFKVNSKQELQDILNKYQKLTFIFNDLSDIFITTKRNLLDLDWCLHFPVFGNFTCMLVKEEDTAFIPLVSSVVPIGAYQETEEEDFKELKVFCQDYNLDKNRIGVYLRVFSPTDA